MYNALTEETIETYEYIDQGLKENINDILT